MKKYLILPFFLMIAESLNAQTVLAPNDKQRKVATQFLGFDPYNIRFINDIENQLKTTVLISDTLIERTDTSLFYFRAYQKDFNPFNMAMDSVKLIVSEIKRTNIMFGNKVIDTLLFFQIDGFLNFPPEEQEIRKAFQNINKDFPHAFSNKNYFKRKNKKHWSGETYRYYGEDRFNLLAATNWRLIDNNQLNITVSFITKLGNGN